jgi:hypothetical protein
MNPTSKNTLKIGGALILIALLLVCGPLSDRFGSGGKKVEEAPPVAAGPPVDESHALDAVVAGALVGSSVDDIEGAAVEDISDDDDLSVLVAAAAVAAAAAGAATGGSGSGGGGQALPPVSAGVPDVEAALPIPVVIPPVADVDAADAFDASERSGDGMGGTPNQRFAPPVAATGGGPVQPFALADSTTLRPCDSAGSGCGSASPAFIGGGGVTPFGAGNPRGGTP